MKKRIDEWFPRPESSSNPSSQPTRYASGTLWPHGEWSLGYASERPDGGAHQSMDWTTNDAALEQHHQEGLAEWLPLDLSVPANSTKRPKRGLRGITGFGQQMVKAAGFLMGDKWPNHRKTLGTVTLPSMPAAARAEVVAKWSTLTRELLRWQSRRLKRLGLPEVVLSVTEIQPKRLAESGEGYLHWHQLWLNVPARHGHWSFDPNEIRSFLDTLIARHCPSYTGGFINVDTRPVKGEAARYLAKYMSKGRQQIEEALEDWGEDNCPSAWWNMTKPTRDMVKAATRKGRDIGSVLEECLDHAWRTGPDFVYAFLAHIEVSIGGALVTVGYRGRFHPDIHQRILSVLESG